MPLVFLQGRDCRLWWQPVGCRAFFYLFSDYRNYRYYPIKKRKERRQRFARCPRPLGLDVKLLIMRHLLANLSYHDTTVCEDHLLDEDALLRCGSTATIEREELYSCSIAFCIHFRDA